MKYKASFSPSCIYVFRITSSTHAGCLKIGQAALPDTELSDCTPNSKILNTAARDRINQYTQTAGIAYELLHTEPAFFIKNGIISITDHEVHQVLLRSGIPKKQFDQEHKANEWFVTDLETVKKAINAAKNDKGSLHPSAVSKSQNPVSFRPEQKEAIEKTKKQFKKHDEMLWNAKMRFGKTLTALQVVKEFDFVRTLILTHRPVVDAGWFEDFGKIFYDQPNFRYGSKNNGDSFSFLESQAKSASTHYVYFASMQDLRGSSTVGGAFDKNDELFGTKWDFIIVDEAHEGTQTELGKNVLNELKKPETKCLQLSGTPFNLISDYHEDQIYTWDYVMEQRAKHDWKIKSVDPNPYASLPRLNIFTFDLGKTLKQFIDEELAFNFREFFKVNETGGFFHENAVQSFLNLICKSDKDSNYPYATEEYRDNFRHSLWMVPGVKEAKALSSLLQSHPVFSQFKIVNVAGEGDEEQANTEALKLVTDAIGASPNASYTITLSCGRLTTGVSVPAWTAVFMLAGSYNTSASSYMQTIFRVQTPATLDGKTKEECFVFDFAPDRTLKVIAETAKISSKAGKTTSEDRQIMGEFLNFCPIISVDGTRMLTYDVERMLEQLKKVYVERVIQNGFEDNYLYDNAQLMKLDAVELLEFDNLKKIMGSSKAQSKTDDIDINNLGFTAEEYEQFQAAEKKAKKNEELSEDEKRLLEEKKEKKKSRDTAVSVLKGISIRMPLLIYGADIADEDTQLNIENFTELVDDKSWAEFMPTGVSKEIFDKFKKYYESDVFRAAGKKIRAIARAADLVSIEERIVRITNIFNSIKNPDKETVLTPWRVVNKHMGDCLGGYVFLDEQMENTIENPRFIDQGDVTQSVFSSDTKILEINSKSGLYPLFLAYNIFRRQLELQFPKQVHVSLTEQLTIWDEVIENNLFVICKTPMAKSITKRTLVGFRTAKVNTRAFDDLVNQVTHKSQNFIDKVQQGKSWKIKNTNNMKFNAIVGNPPYQEMDGGAQASAKPIYQHFVNIARSLNPDYISMIMPSRWYSGGKNLDEFRDSMLEDLRISTLHDFPNPQLIFPGTNIRGGICYFLWHKHHDSTKQTLVVQHQSSGNFTSAYRTLKTSASDTFVRHGEALPIISKVTLSADFSPFSHCVSPLRPFGFRGYFTNDAKYRPTSAGLSAPITCFGKGQRIGYVERTDVTVRPNWIACFKIFTPRANNIGTELNDDNLNTFIGIPGSVCTESYLVLGADLALTQFSASNFCKYLTTKFVRFMHSLAKASHDATAKTFQFVPLQDFTSSSDIDWSLDIVELDKMLYKKYNLTQEEIDFIESKIKPMTG
jgi:hypothetical protein